MTCFPVWSSLLPFAAQIGVPFRTTYNKWSCNIGAYNEQSIDIWRLVEELDRGDKEKQSGDGRDVANLLRVASDRMLL
ncbi:hypothetical protein KXD40_005158 [Peronospora effusa]|nr:hypothetical protein KXD40_005158 [Peronospora effusa]